MSTQSKQQGSVVVIVVALIALAAAGYVGWNLVAKRNQPKSTATKQTTTNSTQQSQTVAWDSDGSGNWTSTGTPPACPAQPLLKAPADISKVTALLWPGQTRGGNYKPHGGLRFDSSKNSDITVSAPMDGVLYRGARFLVSGEPQYTFDVINSCGVMFRVGHLLKLSPKYQAIADKFPAAVEGDSRTTKIDGDVQVKAGEVMATSVGVTVGGVNTFFDFGVYDLRKGNNKSNDAAYIKAHDLELSGHAVCWLDSWLPATDAAKLVALPAGDPSSGKNSDYCTAAGKQVATTGAVPSATATTSGSGSGSTAGSGGGSGTGGGKSR